jgi:ABC-type glycerol-3-phosphate transport system permease component
MDHLDLPTEGYQTEGYQTEGYQTEGYRASRYPVSGTPRKRRQWWHFPLYVLLIVGALLSLSPFIWMISTSLLTRGQALQPLASQIVNVFTLRWWPPQWQNYLTAWNQGGFGRYFFNTAIITALTLSGVLVTSVLAGYAFARIRFVGRNVIFSLLLTTLMVPEIVTTIPNFLTIRGEFIPIPGGRWYNMLPALTVPFMATAFNIFLLRQFFVKIPYDLWDAARIDGSSHLRFLLQIVIPMSKAPIMTVALLSFMTSWNSFLWPLIVTTNDRWRPLLVGLQRFSSDQGQELHLVMAGSLITILPVLVLFFFTQKQFTQAFTSSGLKG